jgi:hypothetical protein
MSPVKLTWQKKNLFKRPFYVDRGGLSEYSKKKSQRCSEVHHYKFDNLDIHLKIMAIRLTERALLFGGRAEISSSATRSRSVGARPRRINCKALCIAYDFHEPSEGD